MGRAAIPMARSVVVRSALSVFACDIGAHVRGEPARTGAALRFSAFHISMACDVTELHITINPVTCDAYGYCAELVPSHLDEWGYPIVEDRAVPLHLKALVKRAVRDCP